MSLLTPTADAFLSPKQKNKIRKEWRMRYELPDEEYVYYDKIKCGILGSCGVIIGVPATIIGLIIPGILDKMICGIGGLLLTGGGIYFLERCFRSGPGAVVNEWGIRIRDYGIIIWEEIASMDIPTDNTNEILLFNLTDQTKLTIQCSPLAGSCAAIIKKIQRFRSINLEQSGYISNRYVFQKK